jgi:hypothetical protein
MKLSLIKIIMIVLAVLFVVNITQAGPRKKVGTSAAPELLIPVGSVGTSLLGSNLSYTSGVDAMYWNPAGLSSINSTNAEVMFSHVTYFADTKLEYITAGAKIGNLGVLGLGIKTLNVGEFEQTTETQPEGTGKFFNPTYITGNLTFARQMTDKIRFGTNIKVISEDLADVKATGFNFDFGIQYIGGQTGLTFGIAIKNLGPSMTFNGAGLDRQIEGENGQVSTQRVVLQDFDMPTSLDLGIAWGKTFNDHGINISSSFTNNSYTSDEVKFGLEYNFRNIFYARGSYNILTNKESGQDWSIFGPAIGAGLHYPVGTVKIGFDYAYRFMTEESLGNNHFFTINLGF